MLAAMEGQRVVLTLAAAAAVQGVLLAVDPWSKSVLLLLEPEQRQQRVPAGLPSCIYVEGRQIKSWRSGDEYAGGAAAFGSGDGVPEGAGCFRRALPCEQRMVLPMRTCAWCSSFRWPGWQSACRCWCCGCGWKRWMGGCNPACRIALQPAFSCIFPPVVSSISASVSVSVSVFVSVSVSVLRLSGSLARTLYLCLSLSLSFLSCLYLSLALPVTKW